MLWLLPLLAASLVANVVLLHALARTRRVLQVLVIDCILAAYTRAFCKHLLRERLDLINSWRKPHEGRR